MLAVVFFHKKKLFGVVSDYVVADASPMSRLARVCSKAL
jgi:hypothetical protein